MYYDLNSAKNNPNKYAENAVIKPNIIYTQFGQYNVLCNAA